MMRLNRLEILIFVLDIILSPRSAVKTPASRFTKPRLAGQSKTAGAEIPRVSFVGFSNPGPSSIFFHRSAFCFLSSAICLPSSVLRPLPSVPYSPAPLFPSPAKRPCLPRRSPLVEAGSSIISRLSSVLRFLSSGPTRSLYNKARTCASLTKNPVLGLT